jgi:hypothetical protein
MPPGRQIHEVECPFHDVPVELGRRAAIVRIAPHHHHVLDRERKGQLNMLGENGAAPRQRRHIERCHRRVTVQHFARGRRQPAGGDPHQRGFARTIRAENDIEAPRPKREIDVRENAHSGGRVGDMTQTNWRISH